MYVVKTHQARENWCVSASLWLVIAIVLTIADVSHAAETPLLPRPDHIVIVIEENHSYTQVIGPPGGMQDKTAPYINELARESGSFTNSHGVTHPSQPNYLHLFSGGDQGVKGSDRPGTGDSSGSSKPPFTTPNLGFELLEQGFAFAGYSESMPTVGFDCDRFPFTIGRPCKGKETKEALGLKNHHYERKHNPWVNWQNETNPIDKPITNQLYVGNNQPFDPDPKLDIPGFPRTPAGDFASLPTVSIVVPDEQHDMHDFMPNGDAAAMHSADDWLKTNLGPYIQWAKTHNSLFILIWDEDQHSLNNEDQTNPNHIPTIFVGPMVRNGPFAQQINHHNVLRTIEDMYGLKHAGAAATTAAPITEAFFPQVGATFTEREFPAKVGPDQQPLGASNSTAPLTVTDNLGESSPEGTVWYRAAEHLIRLKTKDGSWTSWHIGHFPPMFFGGLKVVAPGVVFANDQSVIWRLNVDVEPDELTGWDDLENHNLLSDLALGKDSMGNPAVYTLSTDEDGKQAVKRLVPSSNKSGVAGATWTTWVMGGIDDLGIGIAVKPGTALVYFSTDDGGVGELDTEQKTVRLWPLKQVSNGSHVCVDQAGDVWTIDFADNQILRLKVPPEKENLTASLTAFPIGPRGDQHGRLEGITCETSIGVAESQLGLNKIGSLKPTDETSDPVTGMLHEATRTDDSVNGVLTVFEPGGNAKQDGSKQKPLEVVKGPQPLASTSKPQLSEAPTPPGVNAFLSGFAVQPNGPQGRFFYAYGGRVSPIGDPIEPSRIRIGRVSEVGAALDATPKTAMTPSGFTLDLASGQRLQTIKIQNISRSDISGAMRLVLDDLSSNATLLNSITPPPGSPAVNVDIGNDNVLSPQEQASVVLKFANTTHAATTNPTNPDITYSPHVVVLCNPLFLDGCTAPAIVNDQLSLTEPVTTVFDPTPVPDGPAGSFSIRATFINGSSSTIQNPFFEVVKLSGGNLLLNADNGAGEVGDFLTPDLGADRLLSPDDSFTVDFFIGLRERRPFSFSVDVRGAPTTPPPPSVEGAQGSRA